MTPSNKQRFNRKSTYGLTAIALALTAATATAGSRLYTFDADFDLGTLSGVNHNAPNNNQLQLSPILTTFPIMWIANGGEDTLSKLDTANNKEVARYRTWFGPSGQAGFVSHINDPWSGPAPSRTAVDLDGNAYVANRWFQSDRPAWVMKVLAEGYIDRNGNGVMDTSSDLDNNGTISGGEIRPMADNNPANNRIDTAELQDERIAWAVPVGPNNGLGRALCIGTDGHLWVGLYNTRQFYKISSVDGSVLAGPVSTSPTAGQPSAGSWTPYGCLVDANGTLWSASLASVLGKIQNTQMNPTTANPNPYVVSSFNHGGSNYGIALGNNRVFLGLTSGSSYTEFNPATNTFIYPAASSFAATGISVDAEGNIVTGPCNTGGGVTKFHWSADNSGACVTPSNPGGNANKNGCVIWARGTQLSSETRGVIVDSNNDVWQVSRTGNSIMKYRGTDGLPQGVYPVGNNPYTYSDATGLTQRTQTNPSGTWTVVQDGGAANTYWGHVSWTASVPPGTGVDVQVRTADTVGDLANASYAPVSSGAAFQKFGRYIQVATRLSTTTTGTTPILYDLKIANATCDIDRDGDVDRNDVALVTAARNQPAQPSDPRDADFSGVIDVTDARACVLRCTRPSCATN